MLLSDVSAVENQSIQDMNGVDPTLGFTLQTQHGNTVHAVPNQDVKKKKDHMVFRQTDLWSLVYDK